jgi:TRAP-type mannitol/chloroaromatic compound transport system permease small subunit
MTGSRQFFRIISAFMVATILLFLINRYLAFWQDWPDLTGVFAWFKEGSTMSTTSLLQGICLWALYLLAAVLIVRHVRRTPQTSMNDDAQTYTRLAYFIVRAAFWSVFLVGVADAAISLLRVEGVLADVVGGKWADIMDQARSRGLYIHYPLILLSIVIAFFTRSLSFIWLAFLVVLAEFGIVLSRFIFSYEQAFMGDLVRFWYAALFLFSSAYTLVEGGHVRVDVLYAGLSGRAKAWVNAVGSLVLGLPLCWTILLLGMGSKQGSLIAPVINFEISQSGYGMYVQYLMAAFLLVFAVSMAIQFISYFLSSVAILSREIEAPVEDDTTDEVLTPEAV